MLMDNLENITENMNDDQYEGKWYSYIHNMIPYRVRYLDDEFTIWLASDGRQTLVDTQDSKHALRLVRRSLTV